MFRAKLYFLFETQLRLARPNPLRPPHKNRPLQWKSLVSFGPAGALLSAWLRLYKLCCHNSAIELNN